MSDLPVNRYASAGGVVIDGDRVLVIRRPLRLGPDGRPEMRLPKGHIEPGESREEAARREVGEEAGLWAVDIVADLGHQIVEFVKTGRLTIRDESCFLMQQAAGSEPGPTELQFERVWLRWDAALKQITFDSEREWLRRAQRAGRQGCGDQTAPV